MRKYSLFNFLERKMELKGAETITVKTMEEAAFRELALHIAISYIANTLSKCEFLVYENGVEVHDRLYYMLNVSPNANENSSQFINKFVERYYYDGHALLVPHNDTILCADDFDLDDSNPLKDYIFSNVTFGTQRVRKKYKSGDVFYLKLDNRNVRSLIDLLYVRYGEIISLAIQSFKRTNGKKYKLLLEQFRAGDPSFMEVFENVLKSQLKTFVENDNAVYPQFKGTDLQEFSTAAPTSSGDIIAMRKEIFEVTAQAFKIPLSMMYGNITNMNEIVKVYLSICIDPLADMISEELTRKYFTYEEWQAGCRIQVDTSCINHIDILEVADKVDKLVGCGVGNIDEVRKRLGWEQLGTEFSQSYFMTKNYELAEHILQNISTEGGESE